MGKQEALFGSEWTEPYELRDLEHGPAPWEITACASTPEKTLPELPGCHACGVIRTIVIATGEVIPLGACCGCGVLLCIGCEARGNGCLCPEPWDGLDAC